MTNKFGIIIPRQTSMEALSLDKQVWNHYSMTNKFRIVIPRKIYK